MSTSGGGTVNAVLYVVLLACSIHLGSVLLGEDVGLLLRRPPVTAVALWLFVAVPSLSQIPFPGLFLHLQRDPELIRHHGQWWRLVTSGVVQDGGIAGTVFNLAVLAIVGVVAIRAWGAVRALSIFLAGQVAFNLAATFASPSVGAGNSGATFALAASVIGLALIVRHRPVVLLLASLIAVDGIGLLILRDSHGEVVIGGLLLGLLLGAVSMPNGIVGFSPTERRSP